MTELEQLQHNQANLAISIANILNRVENLEKEIKLLNRKLTDDTFEVIKND